MECRSLWCQRPIHLIRRDMNETESFLLLTLQAAIVRTRRLQQCKCPIDIGPKKRVRPHDRPVNMALRRKVHYRPRPMFLQQPSHQPRIADIAMHKRIVGISLHRPQVLQVARISQLVQIYNPLATASQPVQHKIRTNKSSHTRHEKASRRGRILHIASQLRQGL